MNLQAKYSFLNQLDRKLVPNRFIRPFKKLACLPNCFYYNFVKLSDVTELKRWMVEEFRKLSSKMGCMQTEIHQLTDTVEEMKNLLSLNGRDAVPMRVKTLNLPFNTFDEFEDFDKKLANDKAVREETVRKNY